MKKIVLSTMGAFFLTAVMFSCNQPKETEVSPTTAKAGEEPVSVIDQMEKEEGVKFFKRDVLLKSKDGKNEVLMRFAVENKQNLEMYLQSHELSIIPISQKEILSDKAIQRFDANPLKVAPDLSESIRVLTEPLQIKLADDIIGYGLMVSERKRDETVSKNVRLAYDYQYYEEHFSGTWPELLNITVHNGQIDIATDRKWYWYSSWEPWWLYNTSGPWATLTGGPSAHNKNVDGPWKAVAKVHSIKRYSVCTSGCEKNYTLSFVNL